jgi:hypothetical protein
MEGQLQKIETKENPREAKKKEGNEQRKNTHGGKRWVKK